MSQDKLLTAIGLSFCSKLKNYFNRLEIYTLQLTLDRNQVKSGRFDWLLSYSDLTNHWLFYDIIFFNFLSSNSSDQSKVKYVKEGVEVFRDLVCRIVEILS